MEPNQPASAPTPAPSSASAGDKDADRPCTSSPAVKKSDDNVSFLGHPLQMEESASKVGAASRAAVVRDLHATPEPHDRAALTRRPMPDRDSRAATHPHSLLLQTMPHEFRPDLWRELLRESAPDAAHDYSPREATTDATRHHGIYGRISSGSGSDMVSTVLHERKSMPDTNPSAVLTLSPNQAHALMDSPWALGEHALSATSDSAPALDPSFLNTSSDSAKVLNSSRKLKKSQLPGENGHFQKQSDKKGRKPQSVEEEPAELDKTWVFAQIRKLKQQQDSQNTLLQTLRSQKQTMMDWLNKQQQIIQIQQQQITQLQLHFAQVPLAQNSKHSGIALSNWSAPVVLPINPSMCQVSPMDERSTSPVNTQKHSNTIPATYPSGDLRSREGKHLSILSKLDHHTSRSNQFLQIPVDDAHRQLFPLKLHAESDSMNPRYRSLDGDEHVSMQIIPLSSSDPIQMPHTTGGLMVQDSHAWENTPTPKSDTKKRKTKLDQACLHCGATSSPAWRRGPDGKASLCNACGLKFGKKGTNIIPNDPPPTAPTPGARLEASAIEDAKQSSTNGDLGI